MKLEILVPIPYNMTGGDPCDMINGSQGLRDGENSLAASKRSQDNTVNDLVSNGGQETNSRSAGHQGSDLDDDEIKGLA